MIKRPRDGESVPSGTPIAEVHLPRLYVSPKCLQKCGALRHVAGEALLQAVSDPNSQRDVVCLGKGRLLMCGAAVVLSGAYSPNPAGEAEEDLFFTNPSAGLQEGSGPANQVRKAVSLGFQAHDITAV